jgi:hypothetical protein
MSTVNYGWPLLATNQASPEVTHNAALVDIDAQMNKVDTVLAAYDPLASPPIAEISIAFRNHVAVLDSASAGVYSIAPPVPGTDDDKRVEIVCATAFAHQVVVDVLSPPVTPFNATKSTITFAGNIGDSVVLRAYQGNWLVISNINVALS